MRSEHILSTPFTEDWLRRCPDELAPRLTPGGDARAFVIDAPDGTMAACALGLIHPVLPAPAYPRGRAARVQIVATQPEFRRRGYARAVVSALLDHLADVEEVTLFELHTSPEAAPLYRELGFSGSPALTRMTRHRQLDGALSGAQPDSTWVPPRRSSTPTHRWLSAVVKYHCRSQHNSCRWHMRHGQHLPRGVRSGPDDGWGHSRTRHWRCSDVAVQCSPAARRRTRPVLARTAGQPAMLTACAY
ncbi:GNAT family N-acetyltransferase [Streptomyces sp. WI03-5b]|uniref:GNAT family N-acetyltransferase n=1 Tax=Streptomyces sp. WI03-5b TaxID=462946 RepID=UPI0029AAAAFC|nr:GNAT family N-acetyltransferase [Streptomyces sp. WI03-5b]MDX2620152.1 GNAT family N-acetyltransferase [Streptomyces sp. WI03-5b]